MSRLAAVLCLFFVTTAQARDTFRIAADLQFGFAGFTLALAKEKGFLDAAIEIVGIDRYDDQYRQLQKGTIDASTHLAMAYSCNRERANAKECTIVAVTAHRPDWSIIGTEANRSLKTNMGFAGSGCGGFPSSIPPVLFLLLKQVTQSPVLNCGDPVRTDGLIFKGGLPMAQRLEEVRQGKIAWTNTLAPLSAVVEAALQKGDPRYEGLIIIARPQKLPSIPNTGLVVINESLTSERTRKLVTNAICGHVQAVRYLRNPENRTSVENFVRTFTARYKLSDEAVYIYLRDLLDVLNESGTLAPEDMNRVTQAYFDAADVMIPRLSGGGKSLSEVWTDRKSFSDFSLAKC